MLCEMGSVASSMVKMHERCTDDAERIPERCMNTAYAKNELKMLRNGKERNSEKQRNF